MFLATLWHQSRLRDFQAIAYLYDLYYAICSVKSLKTCEDCWLQRKKRVDSCGAWKSSHINKGSRLKLHFMPSIGIHQIRFLGVRGKHLTNQTQSLVMSRSAVIATISPLYSCSFFWMMCSQHPFSGYSGSGGMKHSKFLRSEQLCPVVQSWYDHQSHSISIISCLGIAVTWAFLAPGLFLVTRALLRWKSGACSMSQSSTSLKLKSTQLTQWAVEQNNSLVCFPMLFRSFSSVCRFCHYSSALHDAEEA